MIAMEIRLHRTSGVTMKFRCANLTVVVALLLSSAVALAYEPTPSPAVNGFGRAVTSVCAPYIKDKKSPGDVSETDYQEYVALRDAGLKEDPKLKEWDKPYLGKVPAEYFPKCEKLFADYAAGVDAEKKPNLLTSCEHNVNARLTSITETYYPDFEKLGAKTTKLWLARKDLETARFYMFKKDGWYTSGGCATNDQYKKKFEPLKASFVAAEKMVEKIEAAKNVKFAKVDRKGTTSDLLWTDLKTKETKVYRESP
jgi:hypothetical protein